VAGGCGLTLHFNPYQRKSKIVILGGASSFGKKEGERQSRVLARKEKGGGSPRSGSDKLVHCLLSKQGMGGVAVPSGWGVSGGRKDQAGGGGKERSVAERALPDHVDFDAIQKRPFPHGEKGRGVIREEGATRGLNLTVLSSSKKGGSEESFQPYL